jgi:hypothetical protein
VLVNFPNFFCDKKPKVNKERFILSHEFGSFSPWSIGSIPFEPVARQDIMAGSV